MLLTMEMLYRLSYNGLRGKFQRLRILTDLPDIFNKGS